MEEETNTNAEPEFEAPTQDTFSFFDVLEEVTYPNDVVTLYMDEAAAYDFAKLAAEIDITVEPDKKQVAAFKKRAEDLKTRIEKSKYTFYLRGVSDDRVSEAEELVEAKFEDVKRPRKNAQGHIERVLPPSEQKNYLRYFNAVVFSLHIEQIVQESTGRVMVAPHPDEVAHLYDKAPGSEKQKLSNAIGALRVRSEAYERSLDEGFFQKP